MCYPVADAGEPTDFSTNPDFFTPTIALPYEVADITVDIKNFGFSGTFEAEGAAIRDVVATGLIDTRPLEAALSTDICLLASFAGNPCVLCQDSVKKCIEVELYGKRAPLDARVFIDRTYDYRTDSTCP